MQSFDFFGEIISTVINLFTYIKLYKPYPLQLNMNTKFSLKTITPQNTTFKVKGAPAKIKHVQHLKIITFFFCKLVYAS